MWLNDVKVRASFEGQVYHLIKKKCNERVCMVLGNDIYDCCGFEIHLLIATYFKVHDLTYTGIKYMITREMIDPLR